MCADLEQLAQEDALFPWLASDCMADETCFYDPDFINDLDEDDSDE